MPFFGLNNIEFEIFRQGVGNHAARKIQWAYRRYKSSSAETLYEVIIDDPVPEQIATEIHYEWCDAQTTEDSIR